MGQQIKNKIMEISYEFKIENSYSMFSLVRGQRINMYPPLLMSKWFHSEQHNLRKPFNILEEEYNSTSLAASY